MSVGSVPKCCGHIISSASVISLSMVQINWPLIVMFGRLAVIDFDECYCLLIYCTVLYLDFARWSILDGFASDWGIARSP